MRGTLHSQVEGLYHLVAKGIGESRHECKLRKQVDTKIHSDSTRAGYLSVWHSIYEYARQKHGVTQVEALTAYMVREWLETKVATGLAPSSIGVYRSAITKLGHALTSLSNRKK